jgi:hypothetical protein
VASGSVTKKRGQLTFPIARERFPDRNLHIGGRSFYFFDLDDNVLCMPTQIYVKNHASGEELAVSTARFAQMSPALGKEGPFADYGVDLDEVRGSFRRFRDPESGPTPFLQDLGSALEQPDIQWKGPSWSFFEHAVHNERPLAIITARGHAPETIALGLSRLVSDGHLSRPPTYLGIYPVNHPKTRNHLSRANAGLSVASLKKAAIIDAVEGAMQRYGESDHHRFGMSDDAPDNLALGVEAMTELKRRYPRNAFFVFDASQDPLVRIEVHESSTSSQSATCAEQLEMFETP